MKTLTRITLAAAALLLTGTGCGDDTPAAKPRPAAAAKPKPAAAPVADTIAIAPVPYVYNPNGMRDPFRAPDMETRRAEVAEVSACKRPLCEFDLTQLSLVAVVTGGPNPLAMLQDPQGRGFNVRRNSRVGNKDGRVTAIRRDEITITEYWTGPDGTKNPNHVSIKLRPDDEVAPVVDLVTGAEYR